MQRGRIVERGPSAQVLDDPQDPYTQLLRASVPGPGWKPVRRTRACNAGYTNIGDSGRICPPSTTIVWPVT